MAEKTKTPLWQKLVLIVGGTAVSIGLVILVLALNPQLLGDPQTRIEASTSVDVIFRRTDGDYFFHQAGRVEPPEDDIILTQHTLSWDENGFRVPALQAESYPIAAFGDSFTEGTTVAAPWPDTLAAQLGVPVRNYGYRGYGPRESAATAEQVMAQDDRSWVLYAHFSGNDLMNANRAIEQDLMGRNPFGQVQWIAERASGNMESRQVVLNENDHYDYPAAVIIGANYYELVYLEDLLWWQVAPPEGFLGSETFNIVGDALDSIAASANEDACKALIFVPSKEQIYYPFTHPSERDWLRENARATYTTSSNMIELRSQPIAAEDEADFIASLGDQRDAMRTLAAQRGWLFIDLLEPFSQRAAAGELLYYVYDGHWNQAGHDLAGQVIADFMRNAEGCPLS